MADHCKKDSFLKEIDFSSSNVAAEWKAFKNKFKIYRIAKKFGEMSQEEQIANLLLKMGGDSVDIYDEFQFDDSDDATKKTLDNTLTFFDNHFEPVKNILAERATFNELRQGSLAISQFIVALQKQASYCEYGAIKDELIRDRIIVGVNDKKLKEYLMDIEDLDLSKCILKAKFYTTNRSQASKLGQTAENLDNISSKRWESSTKSKQSSANNRTSTGGTSGPNRNNPCYNCGKTFHRFNRCPAKEAECHDCHEKGHWAKAKSCKKPKTTNVGEVASNDTKPEDIEGLSLDDSL